MSKSSKIGNELAESDFKNISDWLYNTFDVRYSSNYIRRVLDENDQRKNKLISNVASQYLELKKEFEAKLQSNMEIKSKDNGTNRKQ